DTATEHFDISNPSALDAGAHIGDPYSSSGDDKAFDYTTTSARCTFSVPSNSKKTVEIAFSPTDTKQYFAFAKMRASAHCPEVAVQLEGQGVNQVLTWDPNPLDFAYVTPGFSIAK